MRPEPWSTSVPGGRHDLERVARGARRPRVPLRIELVQLLADLAVGDDVTGTDGFGQFGTHLLARLGFGGDARGVVPGRDLERGAATVTYQDITVATSFLQLRNDLCASEPG